MTELSQSGSKALSLIKTEPHKLKGMLASERAVGHQTLRSAVKKGLIERGPCEVGSASRHGLAPQGLRQAHAKRWLCHLHHLHAQLQRRLLVRSLLPVVSITGDGAVAGRDDGG